MEILDIGSRLREWRLRKKIGLRQLCRQAEISPAGLNSIEKGQTSPTLATLNKILKALGTDFPSFFAFPTDSVKSPVYTPKQMDRVKDPFRSCIFLLPKKPDFRFELLQEEILPGEKHPEWECHECDLGLTVIAGGPATLELENGQRWPVQRGDALYLRAGTKHRLTNQGKRPLRFITVMDPPRF